MLARVLAARPRKVAVLAAHALRNRRRGADAEERRRLLADGGRVARVADDEDTIHATHPEEQKTTEHNHLFSEDHYDFENRGQNPHGGQSQSQHGGQSQHNRGQSPHVPSECLRSTLGLCQSHLSVESEAEDHYRNVNFFIIFIKIRSF